MPKKQDKMIDSYLEINQIKTKDNIAYQASVPKTIDTKAFWNSTLDNKTASQWIEHWRRLDEQHNNQKKVSRNRVR